MIQQKLAISLHLPQLWCQINGPGSACASLGTEQGMLGRVAWRTATHKGCLGGSEPSPCPFCWCERVSLLGCMMPHWAARLWSSKVNGDISCRRQDNVPPSRRPACMFHTTFYLLFSWCKHVRPHFLDQQKQSDLSTPPPFPHNRPICRIKI